MTKPTRTFEVVIAVDECKGCERCVNACPRGVLRMGTHLNKLGFPAVTLTGQPCIGCGGCAAGKGCVFGGVVNEAIEKAKTADAFVFGTPVHYASASGNMTSFMDRLAYAGGKYLAYKPAAICASARRAGTTTTLDQLVKYPEFFHMPLVSGSYWPMVHGSKPEQVLEDEEGCAVMRELGRNMAWLLKCIELGKANGITHPENPRRPMTNFIR